MALPSRRAFLKASATLSSGILLTLGADIAPPNEPAAFLGSWRTLTDAGGAVAPLIVMIFVIGFFPSIFLDRMKDAVQLEYNQFKTVSAQSILYGDEKNAQLLPDDTFAPEFLKGAPGITEEKPADGDEQALRLDRRRAAGRPPPAALLSRLLQLRRAAPHRLALHHAPYVRERHYGHHGRRRDGRPRAGSAPWCPLADERASHAGPSRGS